MDFLTEFLYDFSKNVDVMFRDIRFLEDSTTTLHNMVLTLYIRGKINQKLLSKIATFCCSRYIFRRDPKPEPFQMQNVIPFGFEKVVVTITHTVGSWSTAVYSIHHEGELTEVEIGQPIEIIQAYYHDLKLGTSNYEG